MCSRSVDWPCWRAQLPSTHRIAIPQAAVAMPACSPNPRPPPPTPPTTTGETFSDFVAETNLRRSMVHIQPRGLEERFLGEEVIPRAHHG